MNPYSNSDIVPESIINAPAYRVMRYEVHEVFWTVWGDDNVMKDFNLLGEFQDRGSAFRCHDAAKTGTIRDIRTTAVELHPDGHLEYARIR